MITRDKLKVGLKDSISELLSSLLKAEANISQLRRYINFRHVDTYGKTRYPKS